MGKKISQLTAATSIVSGDMIPIVQSGGNKKLNFAILKSSLIEASASLSGTTWDIGNNPVRELSLGGDLAITTSNATNGKSRGILLVTPNGHTLSINGTDVPLGDGDTWVNVIVKANGSLSIVTEEAISASAGTGGGGGGGGLTQLSTPTLTATVISDTEIDLSWTDVANESSYALYWSPNGSTSWTQIGGTIAAGTASYNHTALTASTHYYYRLKAVGDGITYSDSSYGTDDDTTSAAGPTLSDLLFVSNLGTLTVAAGVVTGTGNPAWDNRGVDDLVLDGDGYIEFERTTDTSHFFLGFREASGVPSGYPDFDCAVRVDSVANGGAFEKVESGTASAASGTPPAVGEFGRIRRTGSVLKFAVWDGATETDQFTFTFSSSLPLNIVAAVYGNGFGKLVNPKVYGGS